MTPQLRTAVVIDYQNVHLTAYDVFHADGSDRHDSLIHPVQFAKTSLARRNERQRAGYPEAVLEGVFVFRGLPHVNYDWEQNRRCMDQAISWRKAGAEVELRDLKYKYQYGSDGRPVKDVNGQKLIKPGTRPMEKGIDVLCALACVRQAMRPEIDLVVLASRDTDLVPVLDEISDLHQKDPKVAKIETVSWFNNRAREEGRSSGGSLKPTYPRRIWNTNLDRRCYEASLDRGDYL